MADLIPLKPKQLDLSSIDDIGVNSILVVQNEEIEPAKQIPFKELFPLKHNQIAYVSGWNLRSTYYSPSVIVPKNTYIQAVYLVGDDGTIQTDKIYDRGTNANVAGVIEHRDLVLSSDTKKHRYMYGQRPCIDIIPYVRPINGNTVSNELILLHNAPSAFNTQKVEKTINLNQEYFKNGDLVATLLQSWHTNQIFNPKTIRIVFPPVENKITDNDKFHELLEMFQVGDEIIDPYSEASPVYFSPNTRIEAIHHTYLGDWIPAYKADGTFWNRANYCSEIILHLNKPRIASPAPPQATIDTLTLRSKSNEDGTRETSYQEQIRMIADVSGGTPQDATAGIFTPINDSQLTNFKNTNNVRAVVVLAKLIE